MHLSEGRLAHPGSDATRAEEHRIHMGPSSRTMFQSLNWLTSEVLNPCRPAAAGRVALRPAAASG